MIRYLLLAAFVSSAAWADQFWLEPRAFQVAPGEAVPVRLFVAHALKDAPQLRVLDGARIDRFRQLSLSSTLDIELPKQPMRAHDFRVGRSGTYVLAMDGEHRFLKTLLQVGTKVDTAAELVAGQKLEIVPQGNPYALTVGDAFPVRVLLDGKPLANEAVFAENSAGETQPSRTDAQGRALFELDRDGVWLVRLVHGSYSSAMTFAVSRRPRSPVEIGLLAPRDRAPG